MSDITSDNRGRLERTHTKAVWCTMSEPVNDNPEPVTTTVTLTDLAAALGIDEDEMLQRFAKIVVKREAALDAALRKETDDGR